MANKKPIIDACTTQDWREARCYFPRLYTVMRNHSCFPMALSKNDAVLSIPKTGGAWIRSHVRLRSWSKAAGPEHFRFEARIGTTKLHRDPR